MGVWGPWSGGSSLIQRCGFRWCRTDTYANSNFKELSKVSGGGMGKFHPVPPLHLVACMGGEEWHNLLFACASPDFLSSDGLYLRAKLQLEGDHLVRFLLPCLCPVWCGCWRQRCACAGWRHLPAAPAAGLPEASLLMLAWAVAQGGVTALGSHRDLCSP